MNTEYPKAMHGPDGGYAVVHHLEAESALRKEGWIDGHEHFTAKAVRVSLDGGHKDYTFVNTLPSSADLDAVEQEKQVAKATAPKKERKPRTRKPKVEETPDAQV